MTDLFASVDGHRATSMKLYLPNTGPWFADAELDEKVVLAGAVAVQFGALVLRGTVSPVYSGPFALSAKVRVVAGAGGWGRELPPKGYHNDAGVKARTIAEDAAREAGETLGTFAPLAERVGAYYVRKAGAAARALEDAAGGAPWWVDEEGKTNVGPRPPTPLAVGTYELLGFDPQTKMATLGVDDPKTLRIGSVLTDHLETPETIRELEYSMQGGTLRVEAWCGGDASGESRVLRALTSLVEQILARRLWGKWRYRVATMAVDGRANLQAVVKAAGLPDVLLVAQRPGGPGQWADLSLGSEVLVEFIAGEATDPIITGFAGRGQGGFVPVNLTIGAATPSDANPAARQNDTVEVLLPPAMFTGTIGTVPATGVLTFPTGKTLGTISTGSSRVGIG